MRINTLITVLALLAFAFPVLAATTDFTANGNIVVPEVTLYESASTDNLLILNASTAESFNFSSGVFTVTNPGSAFNVGSSNSTVKSIYVKKNGAAVACATNPTPGTSYVSLPTAAADYLVFPSTNTDFATTDCCSSVSHASSYNSFPTCGAATCEGGYFVQNNACAQISSGGVSGGGGGSVIASVGLISPSPTPAATAAATLIRYANDPKVYVVENGQKRWVQTAEDFTKLGYKWSDIQTTTQTYPEGTVMKVPSASSAVTLIRYANDPKVYVVENSQKRWVKTAEDFNKLGYKWSDIQTTTQTYADGAAKTATTTVTPAAAVTPAATSEALAQTLKRGSRGAEVLALQQKLKDLGYFPANVEMVDNFGPTTQKAVKAFQKAKGLTQSGIVDAKTSTALNDAASVATPTTAPAVTPAATSETFTQALQRGSKGAEVVALQQKLKDLGYFPAETETDENFGPVTQKAVKAFQKAKGLAQSGIVDAKTRAELNKSGKRIFE